jgi:hypothetical protein
MCKDTELKTEYNQRAAMAQAVQSANTCGGTVLDGGKIPAQREQTVLEFLQQQRSETISRLFAIEKRIQRLPKQHAHMSMTAYRVEHDLYMYDTTPF